MIETTNKYNKLQDTVVKHLNPDLLALFLAFSVIVAYFSILKRQHLLK